MTIQERLLNGKAKVEILPCDGKLVLRVDTHDIGYFDTYTAATNHLIYLIES